jgi:tetratricopeptide (TPR) repeat protein
MSAGEKLAVSTRTVVAADEKETRRAEFLLSTSQIFPEQPPAGIAEAEKPVDEPAASPDATRVTPPRGLDIPTVNDIREALLAGDYGKARAAIDRRLSILSDDVQTLDLLATWHRRQRQYAEAVKVYEQMTRTAPPGEANHARYRRGVLLQENLHDHLSAVGAFEAYLGVPLALRPSSPEARLRLCTSLRALGRSGECHAVLRQLIRENPGTDAAAEAERLLAQP